MLKEKIKQITSICEKLGASEEIITTLTNFKRSESILIRPIIKNKKSAVPNVFRVQHCNPYGAKPFKGGFRFHPNVTIELLRALSIDMTEKCALARVHFGGAKGGLAIDPSQFTESELHSIVDEITAAFFYSNVMGPDKDVFGPDVGTNSQTMRWIHTKIGELNDGRIPNVDAVVTGKPVDDEGCPGREDATSRGGLIVLKRFLKLSECLPENGATLAIQGFGKVGENLARLANHQNAFMQFNFRVVAVSDVNGGIFNRIGFDFNSISKWYKEHKTFLGYKEAFEISNKDLLLLPVDVLIPAAIENQITAENAGNIRAKVVLELANEAISEEAYNILENMGIHAIPGIAANSGGVVVSFEEWALNRGPKWHETDLYDIETKIQKKLVEIMNDIIIRVFEKSQKENWSLNSAAHSLAIETLYEKLKQKHGYK